MSTALTAQPVNKSKLEKESKDCIHSQIISEVPQNILNDFLAEKRSFATKETYQKHLNYFFEFAYYSKAGKVSINRFLKLDKFEAIRVVTNYKGYLIEKGLSESSVNLSLCVLRSLVLFAFKIGQCTWKLETIKSEPVQSYRDTTGVNSDSIAKMLTQCDRLTLKGKRDYAILRLLWGNALRRNEVVSIDISDFDYAAQTLKILGKGRGTQKTVITIDSTTAVSIQDYLSCCNIRDVNKSWTDRALFISLDSNHSGHRLTGTAIYQIVLTAARSAGIRKPMSPHRIRHSAITAALDATNGDVRKVQRFSRHKKLDTLMIYDDNRSNMQGEISDLLGNILDG
jgi:integrase/recombinase XerC